MRNSLIALRLALQFLTIIPVGQTPTVTDQQWGASVSWFPVVGACIGILLMLSTIVSAILFNPALSAALILLVWVVVTGALHLDGIADCADAWVGGLGSKSKTLQLLKDPTCGAMAVVALILILLLKYSALVQLLEFLRFNSSERSLFYSSAILLLPPTIGRLLGSILMAVTPAAVEKGLGWSISVHLSRPSLMVWSSALLLLGLTINPKLTVIMAIICLLCLLCIRMAAKRRIGGFTGDVVGVTIELTEVVSLLVLVAIIPC